MEILNSLSNVIQPLPLFAIFVGTLVGIIIGALPGLSSTMGVALLFPIAFKISGISGVLMLLGIYIGSVYGGSISAILLNTPGTPASACTSLEGYPMTKRGEGGKALFISTFASFTGGIISCIMLIWASPFLAKFALKFGAPEYFTLGLFGLSIISGVSGKSLLLGFISCLLGLIISIVGLDPFTGYLRFTFGSMYLAGGISFIPVLIGVLACAPIFVALQENDSPNVVSNAKIKDILPKRNEIKKITIPMVRSGILGTIIGAIPGAGGDIAAFVSYNETKRFSKTPEKFGTGCIEGVAAPEAGNNAVTGGAMIPLLSLGIPGDSVTAILIGAFMSKGLQPGPLLFKDNLPQVYIIFIGLFIANIFMLILGLLGIRFSVQVTKVPRYILTPLILVLCVLGSFAINNNIIDLVVLLVSSIIGYFMIKSKFPMSPMILGIILGPMVENNLRRSLIMSDGDGLIFFSRPISLTLILLSIITVILPIALDKIKKNKNKDIK